MKKKTKKTLLFSLSFVALGLLLIFAMMEMFHFFVCNLSAKDGEQHGYYVYPDMSMDSLLAVVGQDYNIASTGSIRRASRMQGMVSPRPGYYLLDAKINNRSFTRRLFEGWQTPVRLSFTNQVRNRQQLAARLDHILLLDSMEMMTYLDSIPFLQQYGLNRETAICLFIPNTYEVYWTISPEQLFARMKQEYDHFWTQERLALAEHIGLSPLEVATLASIVESETNRKAEHPTIAALYLNRLRKGMPLQACPTAIYASGNFSLRRVTSEQLHIDSPYNTYMYKGLPPGPIRCANGATMDSVLHAPKTNYLYMCANPDWSGTHVFSSSYAQHSAVARAYQRELNRRKIR